MANGLNAILGGFENSRHILNKEVFTSIFVAVGMSIILSFLLILTVAIIGIWKFYSKFTVHSVLNEQIPLIVLGRYLFLLLI
jgi:membrane protein